MNEVLSLPPAADAAPPGRAHHFFEAQVARTPEVCAVRMQAESPLTYCELDRRADRFACHLRALGVGPEVIVGVCLERSVAAIVSVLAVLKAGGAYLPLDPAYPAERLAYMLRNARASLLIAEPETWPAEDAPVHRRISYREHVARMSREPPGEGAVVCPAELAGTGTDSLAYVIYTSGSTGRPKGVAMAHAALYNLLRWQASACPLDAGKAVLQFAPLSFDVSFQEIFSTLGAGGTLILVPEALRRDPRGLLRLMDEENVARAFLPPVMLAQLAEHFSDGGVLPRALREVITAGEALRITPAVTAFFRALRARNGGGTLHNHYGPTETHVATAYTLAGEPDTWPALPSIGRPIDNARAWLVGEDGEPAAPGQPGALHLGGDCLARGYLHDAELTQSRFVEHRDGTRRYRTGDVARMGPDGNLQFLGRADDQVKVRGFRIEPGEIETVLARHPSIRETAVGVLASPADGSGQELLACFVPHDPQVVPSAADLRQWMLGQCPDYLIPAHFAAVDHLPLTPSGKVDRRALSSSGRPAAGEPDGGGALPPRTPLEKLVARVWQEVLGSVHPGVRSGFFEVGGTSLQAMRVHTRLCQELKREFPITALFQHPTIETLASHLAAENRSADAPSPIRERARLQQQQQQQSAAAARTRLARVGGELRG